MLLTGTFHGPDSVPVVSSSRSTGDLPRKLLHSVYYTVHAHQNDGQNTAEGKKGGTRAI